MDLNSKCCSSCSSIKCEKSLDKTPSPSLFSSSLFSSSTLSSCNSPRKLLDLAKKLCVKHCSSILQTEDLPKLHAIYVKGGISNILIKVWKKKHKETSLAVRIFGQIMNRDRERKICDYLYKHGIGKKIYATFSYGQIEEWLLGRSLYVNEMSNSEIARKVAERLAQLHSLDIQKHIFCFDKNNVEDQKLEKQDKCDFNKAVDSNENSYLAENNEQDKNINLNKNVLNVSISSSQSPLWFQIRSFVNTILSYDLIEKNEIILRPHNFQSLLRETDIIEEFTNSFKCDIVFSHADLLSGNIILLDNGSVNFIDFEYANPLERPFDIANHFIEYAGFDCNWNILPTEEQQIFFIKIYASKLNSKIDCNLLHEQVKAYFLASHLYWGFWALLQSIKSNADFDFSSYAHRRLTAIFLPKFREPLEKYFELKQKVSN